MNTLQQLEQKRLELSDLEQDLQKFQELLEKNQKTVSESKERRLEASLIAEAMARVNATQQLCDDQQAAIVEVKQEITVLEHRLKTETLFTEAKAHAARVSEIKAETTQTLRDLEAAMQPFKEKLSGHCKEWMEARSSYFAVYYAIKEVLKLGGNDEEERMNHLHALLDLNDDIRLSAFFGSGYKKYNTELYMPDLHTTGDFQLDTLANQFFNSGNKF